jgi:excisionase family DNA binding protein
LDERLLTPREVAARLNVSVRTVYLWIESGRLSVVRLSARCTRVPESALDVLLASSESEPIPPPNSRGRPEPAGPAARGSAEALHVDLAPLLWDVDPAQIDEERHASFLIARILTAGRPEHVRWIFRRYAWEQIERVVLSDRRLPREVAASWRALLDLDESPAAAEGAMR